MENFNEKMATWIQRATDLVNKTEYRIGHPVKLIPEVGKKFVRIVMFREEGGQTVERCAYAFIDQTTGDVLKPDGWKRPAKHARGNLMDDEGGLGWLTPWGVECIK